ncbi:DUF3987 domain-containing protein [Candidatus Uabimicrobium sp. HlEnr_7]|uniref:DUF3987 domain-containing protein n=1 Tax=Candidatus Uabimicrobium helgolandensis TaxID=3095367 RepID=UPI003556BB83
MSDFFSKAKQKDLKEYINERTGIAFKNFGENYRAKQCPFCGNKTGFSINNGLFRCFGCNIGGDIITFEAKYSNCKPREACRKILGKEILFENKVKSTNSKTKQTYKYIWKNSSPLDERTALHYLKTIRCFPDNEAQSAVKKICNKLRLNTYKNDTSIVAPIYSYKEDSLVGIEQISLAKNTKIAHGTKKGICCFETHSNEIVIVESLANAISLVSIGITSVATFGIVKNISQIIELFSTRKIYIWFDKGTEDLVEEMLDMYPKIRAIYFEKTKDDKFDVNDLLKEQQQNFKAAVELYMKNAQVSQFELEQRSLIARNKVPKFPVHALPELLKKFCIEVAEAIECPIDFVATPLLTVIGGVIGNDKKIQIKRSWQQNSALYSAIVASPGTGKSPALGQITKLLDVIEKENNELNKKRQQQYEHDVIEYEAKLQLWKKQIKKGVDEVAPEKPESFYYIRTCISDATVESISEILANNSQGVILIRDELTAWTNSHNQYKGGNGSDRQFFLSTWAGASCHVDRKGKAPQYLFKPFLAITGAIPPKEMDTLKKGIKDDGFLDRILFSYPDPICSMKWTEKEVSQQVEKEMQELFLKLYHNNKEQVIEFSDKAKKRWVEWFESHKRNSIEQEEILQNPLNKMPNQLLRISLILAIIKNERQLLLTTLADAIEIIEYYKQHLRRVLGILDETDHEEKIRKIIEYAKKRNKKTISAQNIYQSRFMKIQKATPAKKLLKWAAEQGIGIYEKNTLYLHETVFEDFLY